MACRWEDLRDGHLEVSWGGGGGEENLHRIGGGSSWGGSSSSRSRRARSAMWHGPSNTRRRSGSGWMSATVVVVSTLCAIGIAALVALTLAKSPIRHHRGEGATMAVEAPAVEQVVESSRPSPSPSLAASARPSVAESQPPSAASSAAPSVASSSRPSSHPTEAASAVPSAVPKAPPAPAECVDQTGVYHNHRGDKVSCGWFATVGTYNYEKNCEKTALGKACLYSCREYSDCVVATSPPTEPPTPSPTGRPTAQPTAGPTSRPTSSPTAKPTVPPRSVTLLADADATVESADPAANMGSTSYLKVDGPPMSHGFMVGYGSSGSGNVEALLRFDLSAHHASGRRAARAELRLKAANSCSSGAYLQKTDHPHWVEGEVNWDSAPVGDGTEIGRVEGTRKGFWYSFDVTSVVHHAHQTLSLRLFPTGSNECLFVSRENGSGGGPELRIEYEDGA